MDLSKYEEAITIINRLIELEPNHALAYIKTVP